MPSRLVSLGALIFLLCVLSASALPVTVSAGVPVIKGKLLVYALVDQNGSILPGYSTVLYLYYNDTTVIIGSLIFGMPNSIVISYNPSSNTLYVKGVKLISGISGMSKSEFQRWGFLHIISLLSPSLLVVLPKSFIDNLGNIVKTGTLNYVEQYYNIVSQTMGTTRVVLNINSTLIHVGTGEYKGYHVVIVKIHNPGNTSSVIGEAYWRTDGVLLYSWNKLFVHVSPKTTRPLPRGYILIAEDDLGIKKVGQLVQPSNTVTMTNQTQTPTTTKTVQTTTVLGPETSPATRNQTVSQTVSPTPHTQSVIQTTSLETSPILSKQQTSPAGTQLNTALVAGVAIITAILVIAVLLLRRR